MLWSDFSLFLFWASPSFEGNMVEYCPGKMGEAQGKESGKAPKWLVSTHSRPNLKQFSFNPVMPEESYWMRRYA
ncbi:MAG: hypothetical protein LIQ31_16465 [Planctomycetes bacterium]|nr:hypothetical protein [Planctomycetota bacterium]